MPKEALTLSLLRAVVEQARKRVQLRSRNDAAIDRVKTRLPGLLESLASLTDELMEVGQSGEQTDQPACRLLGGLAQRYARESQQQQRALADWLGTTPQAEPLQTVAVAVVQRFIETLGIQPQLRCDPNQTVSVPWQRLQMVLSELVDNAYEHNSVPNEDPSISIEMDDGRVQLQITNDKPRLSPYGTTIQKNCLSVGS